MKSSSNGIDAHAMAFALNVMVIALVLITFASTALAQAARPAMTVEEFRRSFETPASAATAAASPSHEASSDLSIPSRSLPLLIFIPSFQGTLLSHSSTPLFLAPMTPSTWRSTYTHLLSTTNLQVSLPHSVEYPTATCAPSPFSHIGHCFPLPALGPVHELFARLETLGYVRGHSLRAVGYDWRRGIRTILRDTSFAEELSRAVESSASPALLVAHGYGCPLVSAFLSERPASWRAAHVRRLVCAAAPLRGSFSARAALRDGEGLLTAGGAHRYAGAAVNARQKGRLDFRGMEFELGLRRKRRDPLPDVPGPWDEREDPLAAPVGERKRIAGKFESLREMSEGVGIREGGVPVTCVVGTGVGTGGEEESAGDGVVERSSAEACKEWEGSELEVVQAGHFNLTALVGGVVERLVREDRVP